jgi:hypothetical protein
MEKSQEFLIGKLSRLITELPEVQVRYEQNEHTFTHVIEILPLSVFKNNPEYIKIERDLEKDFRENFPEEEILFISEDSLNEIEGKNVLFDSKGKEHASK